MISIGKTISSFRKKKNLTQIELAKKAGITNVTVSNIENGKTHPNKKVFKNIATALSTTEDELLRAAFDTQMNISLKTKNDVEDIIRHLQKLLD